MFLFFILGNRFFILVIFFQLQHLLISYRYFFTKFLSWIRIHIKTAAGSGSAIRKTAGSGSAKNECGYTDLERGKNFYGEKEKNVENPTAATRKTVGGTAASD